MKLHELNDPQARQKAKTLMDRVDACTPEQAQAIRDGLKSLKGQPMACFGDHNTNDILCRRCSLEAPCDLLVRKYPAKEGQ